MDGQAWLDDVEALFRRYQRMCERASAQVIVFPGVRYERWSQSDDTGPRSESETKKQTRDQRRDVLELAE